MFHLGLEVSTANPIKKPPGNSSDEACERREHNSKTDVVVRVPCVVGVANRTADVLRVVVERAAAQHPER